MKMSAIKKIIIAIVFVAVLTGIAVFSLWASDFNDQGANLRTLALAQLPTFSDLAKPLMAKLSPAQPTFHYIEITNSCGPAYDGNPCVNLRSGPGVKYPVVARLRTGMVLKVEATTTDEAGQAWYKIMLDQNILYPERVKSAWYVAVDPTSAQPFENVGDEEMGTSTATTTKRIVIDLSQEILYAYDGDTLFMQEPISTGLDFTPTPVGDFKIFRKTPSRYMQGPIPGVSTQVYDLRGVPWDLYFTTGGAAIHGAYWHNHFGEPWSHGCVNLAPSQAKKLYLWADIGMTVTVKN